jgi:hypothetical protein
VRLSLPAALCLGLGLASAACSDSRSASDSPLTYSHLLTPSGQHFRVTSAGPVIRGANSTLGLRIEYISEAQTVAALELDAGRLVAALGPELELTKQPELTVRAQFDAGSLALDPKASAYDVVFTRAANGWNRSAEKTAALGQDVSEIMRQLKPVSNVSFPFDGPFIAKGAAAAARWLGQVDSGDLPAALSGMDPSFRAELGKSNERLDTLVERRRGLHLPGQRRELYRMATRDRGASAGTAPMIQVEYVCQPDANARVLERIVLQPAGSQWQVSGYAFQPLTP